MKKKGSALADGILFLVIAAGIIFALFTGFKESGDVGFVIGEHQSELFSVASEGDALRIYLDELARQSALLAIGRFAHESTSSGCGKYVGYSKANSESALCVTSGKESLKRSAESIFLMNSKNTRMDFQVLSREEGSFLILSGRSEEKIFETPKIRYAVKPSFEAIVEFDLSVIDIVDSVMRKASLCSDERCLADLFANESSEGLKFLSGNCEERLAFHQSIEDIHDCAESDDSDCTCAIARSVPQDYRVKISNNGTGLLFELSNRFVSSSPIIETFFLDGANLLSETKIDFDGKERYLLKSGDGLSFTDSAKRSCVVPKKEYRACAITDKEFYFYDEGSNSLKKEKVKYRFAVRLAENSAGDSMQNQ